MSALLDKIKKLEQDKNHNLNTVVALADVHSEDLNALDVKLAEKNIKVGKFVGAGATAVIFELENKDGKSVDSAVLRIEAKGISGSSRNPFVLQPIASVESGEHVAHIMPRAERLIEPPSAEDALATIGALNVGGDLAQAWDLKPDALMRVKKRDGQFVSYSDGTPVLIVGDSNAIGAITAQEHQGFSGAIARAFNIPELEISNARIGMDKFSDVLMQMEGVNVQLREDVEMAGINLDGISIGDRSWTNRTSERTGRGRASG